MFALFGPISLGVDSLSAWIQEILSSDSSTLDCRKTRGALVARFFPLLLLLSHAKDGQFPPNARTENKRLGRGFQQVTLYVIPVRGGGGFHHGGTETTGMVRVFGLVFVPVLSRLGHPPSYHAFEVLYIRE